jgi:AraC-like DNA-binding protein
MKKASYVLLFVVATLLMVGCAEKNPQTAKSDRKKLPTDTLYTQQAAMAVYAYQPELALRIIDSAVIVGNLSELRADMCRARILSYTVMREKLDSLLGGPAETGLDSARNIGERILMHDSVKTNLNRQKEVLEILAYTARMKNDTIGWLQRSREYIDVCRQMGVDSETDALRTEAEIGAAMHCLGQHEEGMAKLDSAINRLDATFQREDKRGSFNELDALIIALKRKILLLASHGQYAETLPLARRILEQLNKYEKHPEKFHDGSSREPKNDQSRADYIRFYRSQALNYITSAYAALGENGNMLTAFQKIEQGVRDVTAREHLARYDALQRQLEAERQQVKTRRANVLAYGSAIFALVVIVFAIVVIIKNRSITRKNRQLAQQIAEAVNYKNKYMEEKWTQMPSTSPDDINNLNEEQLFQHINEVIIHEKLFLDSTFGRQTIMDRFSLSKERVGTIFTKGSDFSKLSNYILQLRLDYSAKVLVEQPDKSIVQVANECGFGSHTYFSSCFRQHYGISPTDYRRNVLKKNIDTLSEEP